MFDSDKELLDKIRLGEDALMELKETRFKGDRLAGPSRDALADKLASFANSRGGVLVLGVRDAPREIVGLPLERLDVAERLLREVCRASVEPALAPTIERRWVAKPNGEEAAIIKVDVPRSLFVHRSPGGYLHRVGSEKRVMSTDYLARMLAQRSQTRLVRFDEDVVETASLDDLVTDRYERFRTSRSPDEPHRLLSNLHLARPNVRGELRPTLAGVLLATEEPRNWLPNAFIQAVAYRGTSVATGSPDAPYQLDAQDLSGPLDRQVADACHFVAKNMKTAAFKYMGRRDLPQFDLTAVFEAVVNAVAHRDYSIPGSKIRLRLFADRLEIYSPGAIPNSLSVDDLIDIQSSRNEVIASLLARVRVPDQPWLTTDRATLMDRRGEGVRLILDRSEALSGKVPQYRLIGTDELLLTIFAADPFEARALRSRVAPGKDT